MGLLSTIGAASGRAFGFTRSAIALATDEFFNRVTLLLPGDGTNGAQNNTFLDSSTNNFTITRNGNTTQGTFSPFSQTGWSNFFGGYAVGSAAVFTSSTSTFTIEGWIFPTAAAISASNIPAVIGDMQPASTAVYWSFGTLASGAVTFYWYDGASKNATTSGTVSLNTWTHIAVSVNSNAITIYINGVQQTLTGTTTLTNRTGSNSSVAFAQFSNAGSLYTGYLSNFSVLSGTAKYSGSFTPSTTPLPTNTTNQTLLFASSNGFVDSNTATTAKTFTLAGTPSVQAFSPFAPTAAYSAATVGGSGYFDGTGDSLSVANNSALSITGNVDASIEFWVYPISGSGVVVNKSGVSGSSFPNYSVSVNSNGSISFLLGNSGSPGSAVTTITTSAGTVPFNAWSHVVCTKTYVGGGSVNNYRVMINGILSNNGTQNNASDGNPGALTIGFEPSSTDDINAYISQLRIFNTSIPAAYQTSSTTNGTSIYTVPTTPVTASTSSICTLFTNGGIIDATSDNVLETVGNAQISTAQSKFGGSSMYFDGTGDYLITNSSVANSAFGTGDFTVEFWLYTNAGSTTYNVIDWRPPSTQGAYFAFYLSSGVPVYYTSSADRITGGSAIPATTWTHVAISRSGTSTRMFINGTQSGSTYTDNANYLGVANRPAIGGGGIDTNSLLNGYIDDLRVTKFARYTSNFTAPTAPFATQ
jgi:hypothetical protein